MGEIVLVRHGQANSKAQTEADYDRLSELGHQQATWLGTHLRAHEPPFDRVITGSLRRHKQTATAMGEMGPQTEEDLRLNEMDYFDLGRALEERHGVPMPGPDEFADHIPQVFTAWHKAEIQGRESFAAFESRVMAVLQEAAAPGIRVLCITSGGVIGMVMRALLGLDPIRTAQVLLPIRNTSLHRVQVTPRGAILGSFNAHPHLDHPDRHSARTTF